MGIPSSWWQILKILDKWNQKCTNTSTRTNSISNYWKSTATLSPFSNPPIQAPMTSPPPRQRLRPSPILSPRDEPTPPRSWTPIYDTDGVGKTRKYFLGILLLTGRPTDIEIKNQYMILAIIYHPDKHESESTGMALYQAEYHFKNINNAYYYFRSQLWKFPHFWSK